jgi:hypothetical protein
MRDFLAALGLVFAIEGLLFAAFPRSVAQAMREASEYTSELQEERPDFHHAPVPQLTPRDS